MSKVKISKQVAEKCADISDKFLGARPISMKIRKKFGIYKFPARQKHDKQVRTWAVVMKNGKLLNIGGEYTVYAKKWKALNSGYDVVRCTLIIHGEK